MRVRKPFFRLAWEPPFFFIFFSLPTSHTHTHTQSYVAPCRVAGELLSCEWIYLEVAAGLDWDGAPSTEQLHLRLRPQRLSSASYARRRLWFTIRSPSARQAEAIKMIELCFFRKGEEMHHIAAFSTYLSPLHMYGVAVDSISDGRTRLEPRAPGHPRLEERWDRRATSRRRLKFQRIFHKS